MRRLLLLSTVFVELLLLVNFMNRLGWLPKVQERPSFFDELMNESLVETISGCINGVLYIRNEVNVSLEDDRVFVSSDSLAEDSAARVYALSLFIEPNIRCSSSLGLCPGEFESTSDIVRTLFQIEMNTTMEEIKTISRKEFFIWINNQTLRLGSLETSLNPGLDELLAMWKRSEDFRNLRKLRLSTNFTLLYENLTPSCVEIGVPVCSQFKVRVELPRDIQRVTLFSFFENRTTTFPLEDYVIDGGIFESEIPANQYFLKYGARRFWLELCM